MLTTDSAAVPHARARRFAAAIAAGLADSAVTMTLAELSRAFRKVNYSPAVQ